MEEQSPEEKIRLLKIKIDQYENTIQNLEERVRNLKVVADLYEAKLDDFFEKVLAKI